MSKPIQCYMILGAVGEERGAPMQFFWDPFKAREAFSYYGDVLHAFGGGYTAFLVAYEVQPDGGLRELAELGRK